MDFSFLAVKAESQDGVMKFHFDSIYKRSVRFNCILGFEGEKKLSSSEKRKKKYCTLKTTDSLLCEDPRECLMKLMFSNRRSFRKEHQLGVQTHFPDS